MVARDPPQKDPAMEKFELGRSVEKFALGRIVATPGAMVALQTAVQNPLDFIERHARGDWGEVCEDDKRANDDAIKAGNLRVLSAYKTTAGDRIWIITEADRSVTTLLLPEEY